MPGESTRNAQGGGTIRQRPDGRWEARYTVGRDPGTGKQLQRGPHGTLYSERSGPLRPIKLTPGTRHEKPPKPSGFWGFSMVRVAI